MTDRKEKKTLLGLERDITRRDFVGNTLVGAGAGLLAMHAPAAPGGQQPRRKKPQHPPADARTPDRPDAGLDRARRRGRLRGEKRQHP